MESPDTESPADIRADGTPSAAPADRPAEQPATGTRAAGDTAARGGRAARGTEAVRTAQDAAERSAAPAAAEGGSDQDAGTPEAALSPAPRDSSEGATASGNAATTGAPTARTAATRTAVSAVPGTGSAGAPARRSAGRARSRRAGSANAVVGTAKDDTRSTVDDDRSKGTGSPDRGAAVSVEGLGVKGPRGWAFRGVSGAAAPGSLVALAGPSGTGRTCLLLALTGRMRIKEGHADVGGLRLPRKMAAVRRISALAHVPGVSDLDQAFTVGEHLREAALLRRRFDGSPLALLRPRAERAAENRRRIDAALATAGLDPQSLPKGERTSVRDLERLEALRLSLALALVGEPRLLAVDDTDLKLGEADEAAVWTALRAVADSGVTVLAVCAEAPAQADTVIRTEGGTGDGGEAPAVTPKTRTDGTGGTTAAGSRHTHTGDPGKTEEGAADALAETGRA